MLQSLPCLTTPSHARTQSPRTCVMPTSFSCSVTACVVVHTTAGADLFEPFIYSCLPPLPLVSRDNVKIPSAVWALFVLFFVGLVRRKAVEVTH